MALYDVTVYVCDTYTIEAESESAAIFMAQDKFKEESRFGPVDIQVESVYEHDEDDD